LSNQIIPFADAVDPDRILETAAGESYVYTTDNVVAYYEMIREENDRLRYVKLLRDSIYLN
jgi:hypothetical protein